MKLEKCQLTTFAAQLHSSNHLSIYDWLHKSTWKECSAHQKPCLNSISSLLSFITFKCSACLHFEPSSSSSACSSEMSPSEGPAMVTVHCFAVVSRPTHPLPPAHPLDPNNGTMEPAHSLQNTTSTSLTKLVEKPTNQSIICEAKLHFSFLICFQFIEGIFLQKLFFEFYFCKISLPLRFQSDRELCSGVSYPRLPVEPSGAPPSATHTPQITVQAIAILALLLSPTLQWRGIAVHALEIDY